MTSIELEERRLMTIQLEHKAEKSRLIDRLRFDGIRRDRRIFHKCILCNNTMGYNQYEELSYIRTIHMRCRKALTKFKKQSKYKTLEQYLKIMDITVIPK